MSTLENVNVNLDFLVINVKYALMDQKLYSMAALIVSILFCRYLIIPRGFSTYATFGTWKKSHLPKIAFGKFLPKAKLF